MRIHTFRLTCDVCGGPGMGTIRTAGAAWDRRSTIAHSDPRICRSYLDAERTRVERERREWARNLQPIQRLDITVEERRLSDLQATIDRLRKAMA